jgi:hypothetical protein
MSSVDFFELAIMALILEQQERRWLLITYTHGLSKH